ncbi:MAG: metallophosphoesterase [Ignavibacteriae bacterium]|nr:metallophosphoesterase [Ignavibacteriota bacterium]
MGWFFRYALILAVPLFGMYYFNTKQILNAGGKLWNWNRKKARLWFVLVSCYANLLPLVALVAVWLGGRPATQALAGENRLLDYFIVYPFWFSLVITAQTFFLIIFWKLAKTLVRYALGKKTIDWQVFEPKVIAALYVFGFCYTFLSIIANTWVIRVNERSVQLPEHFAALDGVTIVQVSDVQGDGRTTPDFIRSLVEKANSLNPDIILFGGDVVTSGPKYVESTINVLAELNAKYVKAAAIGDHDMFSGKQPIIDGMKRAGFVVLEDSSLTLTINETPVTITGLVYTYRQRPGEDEILYTLKNGNGSYKILTVHQPREFLVDYAKQQGYHLFTAGHTHGGAIAFGIPGMFLVAPSRFETKYFTGFYEVGDMLVSVNNGLGHTLAPIRFQAPVEITVIRLVK